MAPKMSILDYRTAKMEAKRLGDFLVFFRQGQRGEPTWGTTGVAEEGEKITGTWRLEKSAMKISYRL